jgi:hypothetical protein
LFGVKANLVEVIFFLNAPGIQAMTFSVETVPRKKRPQENTTNFFLKKQVFV